LQAYGAVPERRTSKNRRVRQKSNYRGNCTHSIQPTGCELAEAGPRETGEKQDDISRSLTQFTEIAGSSRDLHPVAGLRQKKVAAEGVDQFPLG
jgi:hypothetical protein